MRGWFVSLSSHIRAVQATDDLYKKHADLLVGHLEPELWRSRSRHETSQRCIIFLNMLNCIAYAPNVHHTLHLDTFRYIKHLSKSLIGNHRTCIASYFAVQAMVYKRFGGSKTPPGKPKFMALTLKFPWWKKWVSSLSLTQLDLDCRQLNFILSSEISFSMFFAPVLL